LGGILGILLAFLFICNKKQRKKIAQGSHRARCSHEQEGALGHPQKKKKKKKKKC
jgi:hypothetical protein